MIFSNRDKAIIGMIEHARSLFERNYTYSTGGNISHRLGEGMLIEATNTSFGRLTPEDFAACDLEGAPTVEGGPKPSKEAPFHAIIYRRRPEVNAILHLHAPAALTLSCLAQPTDTGNVLPVISSGSITRVGRLPLIEYIKPGASALPDRVGAVCKNVNAILMQNHGILVFAPSLEQAVDIAEEAEQNIRVFLSTQGQARVLSDDEMKASKPLYGAAILPGSQRPELLPGISLR